MNQYIRPFKDSFRGIEYNHNFHIVLPLTIEPAKPRLCINLMYLNNWVIDIPFSLDTLKDVPRATEANAFYTHIDDKTGFDN